MMHRTALVADVEGTVKVLFHRQAGGAKPVFNLIAFTSMNEGVVGIEVALGFQTQNRVQVPSSSQRAMQIGRLSCRHSEPLVVARQIRL